MSLYEIEIKSLLGDKEHADMLKAKIISRGAKLSARSRQLNHYFVLTNVAKFRRALAPHIEKSRLPLFEEILRADGDFSVRTRDADGKVLLSIKVSIGEDTSANGVSRMEFESEMKMSIDELDQLLLNAGLGYQAKWSRERQEYKLDDVNICLDKNAGYGYLAEFEKLITDRTLADDVKKELLGLMAEFGVKELPQDRLARMFAHYNEHWQDYYGTEQVFNIE